VQVQIDTDDKPASASDAYLRLHLLSHRFVQPRTINLDGMFGQLVNVAWTNLGPVPVDGIEELRWRVRRGSCRGSAEVGGARSLA
jgi:2,3,4,5-tetrahydropyridine-2-carboxylate N-succinyltransferase